MDTASQGECWEAPQVGCGIRLQRALFANIFRVVWVPGNDRIKLHRQALSCAGRVWEELRFGKGEEAWLHSTLFWHRHVALLAELVWPGLLLCCECILQGTVQISSGGPDCCTCVQAGLLSKQTCMCLWSSCGFPATHG